jgi:hypothetical protein
MNETKSKKMDIIESTIETLEGSSIHAIPNITRNKFYSIKFMWLICFLASFGVCAWLIFESIADFLKFEVVTKFYIKNEDSLRFPIINICNLNFFATPYSFQISNILSDMFNSTINNAVTAKILTNYLIKTNKMDKNKVGFDLNEIILNCNFIQKPCNLTNDFEEYFDPFNGRCFRFNSGKNMFDKFVDQKYIYQSGSLGSLQLELFIGSAVSNNKPFSIENGFNIFVQDDQFDSNEGVKISPGSSTVIALSKYRIKRKPKPFSDCTEDLTKIESYPSDFYKKIFSPNKTYHYKDCFAICIQKKLGIECKCQSSKDEYLYFPNMRLCAIPDANLTKIDLVNDDICAIKTFSKFINTPSEERDCDCPKECQSIGYDFYVSAAEYPSYRHYSNNLEQNDLIKSKLYNVSFSQVRESVARVQILFSEMKQTYIEENEKTTIVDLVSGVGGTLGLFLGKFQLLNTFFNKQ